MVTFGSSIHGGMGRMSDLCDSGLLQVNGPHTSLPWSKCGSRQMGFGHKSPVGRGRGLLCHPDYPPVAGEDGRGVEEREEGRKRRGNERRHIKGQEVRRKVKTGPVHLKVTVR